MSVDDARFQADLAATMAELRRFLHPDTIADWMEAPKVQLGDRTPIDLLRDGRLEEVLQAVNAAEHGSFA
jgi:uncharacterized protein (DUF2384 family)